jgi:hypothetical protein
MILVVYFLPQGIVPALRNLWQRRQEKVLQSGPAASGIEETAR